MRVRVIPSKDWKGRIAFRLRCSDTGTAGPARSYVLSPRAGNVLPVNRGSSKTPGEAIVSLGLSSQLIVDRYRQAGGAIASWLIDQQESPAGIHLEAFGDIELPDALQALAEGLHLGCYRFDKYKQAPRAPVTQRVDILVPRKSSTLPRRLRRADDWCTGVVTARDLAHEPPNIINPPSLARRVKALATRHGLKCKVLDERQMAKLKMKALLAVGQGSVAGSRLIVLEYPGRSGTSAAKPVILVGKAITFDTGGYSVKSSTGMIGMKYDKCGGMAVIGAMVAVARSKPAGRVIGIIAAAENMISGAAYRPDDIITAMNGKTVEIVSADAEGRLVLADALTYAQRTYKPKAMIDVATLTGGVTVTLGSEAAAVMCNDEALQNRLIDAGRRAHERLWPLPLWDEYDELIRGDDSDLKNSAGRPAQTVVGGIFLKQFVDPKVPWAHLDIASVAKTAADQPCCPRGATGFGVRLLAEYILDAAG